jgi:hypothetical protein
VSDGAPTAADSTSVAVGKAAEKHSLPRVPFRRIWMMQRGEYKLIAAALLAAVCNGVTMPVCPMSTAREVDVVVARCALMQPHVVAFVFAGLLNRVLAHAERVLLA